MLNIRIPFSPDTSFIVLTDVGMMRVLRHIRLIEVTESGIGLFLYNINSPISVTRYSLPFIFTFGDIIPCLLLFYLLAFTVLSSIVVYFIPSNVISAIIFYFKILIQKFLTNIFFLKINTKVLFSPFHVETRVWLTQKKDVSNTSQYS